jgi:very-short-patch-repair endonuclease
VKVKIPKPLSEGEERLAMQLRIEKIPFVREFQFDPQRNWRFDFLLPGKIVVEVDGGAYTGGRHTRATGFINDMEKLNAATLLGYRVLRYTPDQVKKGKPIKEIAAFVAIQGSKSIN